MSFKCPVVKNSTALLSGFQASYRVCFLWLQFEHLYRPDTDTIILAKMTEFVTERDII